jgi:hypothetical protein
VKAKGGRPPGIGGFFNDQRISIIVVFSELGMLSGFLIVVP